MIVLDKVDKYFGLKKALDNVSFKVTEGEIIGFVGPNGAGKTTTMRVIVGFLKPTSGKVLINEQEPINNRIDVLKQIGYLPENNPLYQEMKVFEYLNFITGMKSGQIDPGSLMQETGIEEVLQNKIEELSRGFKQRVGLAAALIGNPKILILDEPTTGLDPIEQEKIRNLIKNLGRKKTIILSTHILSEVEDVATRVIIIDRGKIIYDGVKPKTKGGVDKLFRKLVK
jgi:ABC-2 type transport system ATP-binding protein